MSSSSSWWSCCRSCEVVGSSSTLVGAQSGSFGFASKYDYMPSATMQEGRDLAAPLDGEELGDEWVTVNVFDARLAPPSHLGTPRQIEAELDSIGAAIRKFHAKTPDRVMQECSGYSARLTELVVLLHRVETRDRTYKQIRTMQVDKYIQELDRQFKISSRLIEVQRQDLELLRGAGV